MSNINSFAQNINQTITQSANQLALLSAIQQAVANNNAVVDYLFTDTNGETMNYQLPSYDAISNRLRAVEESLNSLASGKGTINLSDGSRRTITVSSVPKTPQQITGLVDPTTFTVDSNWFFEELMFPGALVSIDLTNQIEDSADRVKVTRIILAANNDAARLIWESDLALNSYDYISLKTLLSNNGIPYYEDEEIVDMPVVSNTVAGVFQITEDPAISNKNIWYTFDTLTYSTISADGTDLGRNNILSVDDTLRYMDSIFKIDLIDLNNNKVMLRRIAGSQTPGAYSTLNIYQDPFASKVVKVRFGAHEYNIIYFKGINESYNLQADTWSTPVKFASDELILEGTSGLQEQSFASYYSQFIMDWGSKMIAEIKEHKISAWSGNIPNTPTINGDDFRVVQINTQINAAIDTTDAKNTASEIESVKSQISSLKSTIAAQKTDLQSAVNLYTYNSIQQQIATNTTDLNNLQTTYSTLVDSFQTIVKENSAITTDPKYHIRGFFPIPEYKYQDEENGIYEEIIGFDVAYRYIKEDSTATQLNTFTYTNNDGTEVTGTFTDWIIETGPMKTKVYDADLQRYIWKGENVADGTETNINLIDIAINKGEQVEIKVRAISECGYPENPLRSEWSNSVIVSFPSTLATSNEIADLIKMVNDDALNITIINTLNSNGVTDHLSDTIPNTNSVNGLYFKHMAENIAYEETGTTSEGTTVTNSISLLDKIAQMFSQIEQNRRASVANSSFIEEIKSSESSHYSEVTQKIQTISDETVDISTHVNDVEKKIDDILNEDGNIAVERIVLTNENGDEDVALSSLNQSELFIINNHDGTNKDLADLHVRYLYVHPESATTSQRYSVYELIVDNQNAIKDNTKRIDDIDSLIEDISTKIVDIAYVSDIDKLNDKVIQITTSIEKISQEGDLISNNLYLSGRETRLSGSGGKLNVYNGQSSQWGLVYAEDFILANNNRTISDVVRITDENTTNIGDNLESINALRTDIDTIYRKSGGRNILSADTVSADTVNTQDLTLSTLAVNNGEFKPVSGSGVSGILVPAIFSDVTVYNTGSAIGKGVSLSELNDDFETIKDEYGPEIDKVKAIVSLGESTESGYTITGVELVQADELYSGRLNFGQVGDYDGYIDYQASDDGGLWIHQSDDSLASIYVKDVNIGPDEDRKSLQSIINDYYVTQAIGNDVSNNLREHLIRGVDGNAITGIKVDNVELNKITKQIPSSTTGNKTLSLELTSDPLGIGTFVFNGNINTNGNSIYAHKLFLDNQDITSVLLLAQSSTTSLSSQLGEVINKINNILGYLRSNNTVLNGTVPSDM